MVCAEHLTVLATKRISNQRFGSQHLCQQMERYHNTLVMEIWHCAWFAAPPSQCQCLPPYAEYSLRGDAVVGGLVHIGGVQARSWAMFRWPLLDAMIIAVNPSTVVMLGADNFNTIYRLDMY